MNPKIWGKHAWNFLHFVTLGYPINPSEEDKQNYYEFLSQLRYVLPCAKCRHNYVDHLIKHPLTEHSLATRDNLVKWGIDLHNMVNANTGKPVLSYSEAFESIQKLSQPQTSDTSSFNWVYFILLLIILILIGILVYMLLRN